MLAKTRLSEATYVEKGYGQVEPNHLSAQVTGQIYAQLPAAAEIAMLENGQFAKYDYANNAVNFTGKGEWMLVYNEVKVYRDGEGDADFAMIKENYNARIYSMGEDKALEGQSRFYGKLGNDGRTNPQRVTIPAPKNVDIAGYTEDPFKLGYTKTVVKMPENTTMVPRLFKTNIGDIMTLNTIKETELSVGEELVVGDDGYLTKSAGSNAGTMKWEVVKVYTMPDHQKGVKVMRIA